MIKKVLELAALLILTITTGFPAIGFAAQEGSDQLRVQTGVPKERKLNNFYIFYLHGTAL